MSEQTRHILLVEDEPAHAKLACRAFESASSKYRLTVVKSLREARAFLHHTQPAIAIVDLLLPDGHGTDLIPSGHRATDYPVVVLTSYGNEQVAVEAMKAGALDYVVKSDITLDDMPHIVERALREWEHITERRRAEAEIRRLNEELEQRVAARTAELKNLVNAMAGREVRMAQLKIVIKELRQQLRDAGLEPVADDPLLKGAGQVRG